MAINIVISGMFFSARQSLPAFMLDKFIKPLPVLIGCWLLIFMIPLLGTTLAGPSFYFAANNITSNCLNTALFDLTKTENIFSHRTVSARCLIVLIFNCLSRSINSVLRADLVSQCAVSDVHFLLSSCGRFAKRLEKQIQANWLLFSCLHNCSISACFGDGRLYKNECLEDH